MGEMLYNTARPPSVEINGTISYVPQKAWIINATIKDNIIFDNTFNEDKYLEAIKASCLQADLKTFIKRDQTEIGKPCKIVGIVFTMILGEKGVNLSGGQKARVALARAIYADTDIYLLDDPLRYKQRFTDFLNVISAVDAHVGKYILEECLMKRLNNRTRVLITHKLESLRYVDHIYIMKGGKVVAEGQLDEIKKSVHYQEIEQKTNKKASEHTDIENEIKMRKSTVKAEEEAEKEAAKDPAKKSKKARESSFHEADNQKEMLEKLMLTEDRQTGAVTFATWKSFFVFFGTPSFLILLFSGKILRSFCYSHLRSSWLLHLSERIR